MQWGSGGEESGSFPSWGVTAEDTPWITCCPSSQERFSKGISTEMIFPAFGDLGQKHTVCLPRPWETRSLELTTNTLQPKSSSYIPVRNHSTAGRTRGICWSANIHRSSSGAVFCRILGCKILDFEVVQLWSMKARILTGNSTVKGNVSSTGNAAFW